MFNPFGSNSWGSASSPNPLAGARSPGHNRPKRASDWLVQVFYVFLCVGAAVIFGGSNNVVPMYITLAVAIPYILMIEWLSHLEDRGKANRIWAVIWAVTAILAVRAHEQKRQTAARDYRAPRPPPPGSTSGLNYGDR